MAVWLQSRTACNIYIYIARQQKMQEGRIYFAPSVYSRCRTNQAAAADYLIIMVLDRLDVLLVQQHSAFAWQE